MRPVCRLAQCGAEAVWRLSTTCECMEYRCDECRDETQRTLMHLIVTRRPGPCVRCSHVLDPGRAEWVRLEAEDELSLTGLLVADVESALKGVGA